MNSLQLIDRLTDLLFAEEMPGAEQNQQMDSLLDQLEQDPRWSWLTNALKAELFTLT